MLGRKGERGGDIPVIATDVQLFFCLQTLNLAFVFLRKYLFTILISDKSEGVRKCQGPTDRSGV